MFPLTRERRTFPSVPGISTSFICPSFKSDTLATLKVFVILRGVVEKCRLSRFNRKSGFANEVRIEEIAVEAVEGRRIHWPWTINWRSVEEVCAFGTPL
jgi:hypothetical protein